jgi:hypothetical protein
MLLCRDNGEERTAVLGTWSSISLRQDNEPKNAAEELALGMCRALSTSRSSR